ncbi:MAG: [Fe-Fe] hydrogenase large subunit C-terminal domain-containing protein [Eubacterium ventriosum]
MLILLLTFEETMGLFDAKAVDFKSLEVEEPLRHQVHLEKDLLQVVVLPSCCRVINEMRPDMEVKTVKAEGLAECKKMLMMAKAGKYDGYLLEGMACPGGCVGGAGVLSDGERLQWFTKDMARSELKDPTETQYKDFLELTTSED